MTLSLYAMVQSSLIQTMRGGASVGRPLDLGEVYALLGHIPERRKLTQLEDRRAELLRGIVDCCFGGETAEGETDRAVRRHVVAPQRAEHVGRLQRSGGAGRTGRHRQE